MSTTDPKHTGDGTGRDGTPAPPEPEQGEPGADTGRHAVQRPAPTPPEPDETGAGTGHGPERRSPDPVVAPATSGAPDASDGGRGPAAGHATPASTAASPAASTRADSPAPTGTAPAGDGDGELFPEPNAPRTPHAGTHVLGVLVGLVLAPLAVGVLLVGQSRILEVQVDGWDASLQLLGIVLVSVGAVLLAALLLLGLWTAAVPVTAGLLLGVLGGLQLYAPGVARATTLEIVDADAWDLTVTQVTVAGTSGTTIVAGVLLLTAGVTIALGRRHGVRLGTFRERNRAA
ncbi:hypothetical protein [Cellulomonas wangsupingiae]|uniref:Uncharacterized protein n=1 Tax=Cellulomonas wangsupingiae TaxID=2968085 RepID=A0ABY5K3H8_9CELL|nr:hypothetical protein [Cellulomonas wangsupingiae]MCC2335490.1 hypothetical protein [Cellulomonas wangsupingiae]UUI64338.1 hypothetical protein NP075_14585 [Cellulomonas wangsupingiae]